MAKPIRVVLVDDQPLARFTMGFFLNSAGDIQVVGEAEDGEAAVAVARAQKPDVVLMDYFLPVRNGAEATAEILRIIPNTRVIGMSHNDSEAVIDSMRKAGAAGFVAKRSSMPDLIEAIHKVAEQ
jgi:DNA-binding NarL/FixJ family response regulator